MSFSSPTGLPQNVKPSLSSGSLLPENQGGVLELESRKSKNNSGLSVFSADALEAGEEFSPFEIGDDENYMIDLIDQDGRLDLSRDDLNIDLYTENDVLRWALNLLTHSDAGYLMVREAMQKDWRISLEDLSGGEYVIDVTEKMLVLDNHSMLPSALCASKYFKNMIAVSLIKALRDLWQENRHGGFAQKYSPEHTLIMERVRAADCDVIGLMVAWELRREGYPYIWRHLIGSEITDMALAFSGDLDHKYYGAKEMTLALRRAFSQWFENPIRIRNCDRDTLNYMDDVLEESDVQDPFGDKKPTKLNIEILSCLPDKSAYLQGQGGIILSDPLYLTMEDEINQTHLFHIMYDTEAHVVEDVPFRDADLARKIFPEG